MRSIKLFSILMMMMFRHCFSYEDVALAPYQNQILSFREIHGASSYTLILMCDQKDPIITYAPASYDESKNSNIVRFLMPNSIIDEKIIDQEELIKQKNGGVEVLLFGPLLKKVIGDHMVIMTVGIK